MHRSRKVSLVSLAALSLPLAGAGVATAQQLSRPQPAFANQVVAAPAAAAESSIDPMRGWAETDMDAYAAYWEHGYNYQQLLALADKWNVSEFEAKARAGGAILAGDSASFDDIVAGIEPAPSELQSTDESLEPLEFPTSAFWDAGFDYDDALVLAEEWNIDVYESKILAAELIGAGHQVEVEAVVGQP